jgi:UDP-N-acetylglucosamine--N-acetylmuramyl-(pentapeptide) pyrophosphoryl-undecaprenol N-acetylglucosamine transferase
MNIDSHKNIILSGGGSGGSVTTLLAVARDLIEDELNLNFIFVGTKNGPERVIVDNFKVKDKKIDFITLPSGKLRRYFSVYNFIDFFKIFSAFIISFFIINKTRPSLIISAGGFPSVPFVWAAYLKKIPILIHQQDVRPGLANRLMAPFARLITVTFETSLRDYGPKAVWVGNPSNRLGLDESLISNIKEKYHLISEKPLVLFTGGGTGSQAINDLVVRAIPELISSVQVIHLTGKGKMLTSNNMNFGFDYQAFELLNNDDVFYLMAASSLVVSRCGLATLTELCELEKPAILIPMPDSHQEDNALVFQKAKAAIILKQKTLSAVELVEQIKNILADNEKRKILSSNISKVIKKKATETMVGLIEEILSTK